MIAYKMFGLLNKRCKHILNIIQKCGPVTKNELVNKTQMKLTTLNRDIQILMDNNMVIETAIAESTGGRKPVLYDVNPNEFYSIGIDISRTYTQIVITNLKIKIVGEKIINQLYDLDNIIEIIPNCINELLEKLKIHKSMIVGIGIGIFEGFEIKELEDELINQFGIPLFIDNGVNAAVAGEYFFGSGKGKQNIAYINCGVGIRTGVISSGVVIKSINCNCEDAFGHMIVDVNGQLCSCGNYGCVESYASIAKITEKFIAEQEKEGKLGLNKIDYTDICSLAEEGDSAAVNILMDAALHFGTGLANFIRLFDFQLVILSGPLIQHSELFYQQSIKIAIEKSHLENNSIHFERFGYFKNQSIAVGTSVIAIERLFAD